MFDIITIWNSMSDMAKIAASFFFGILGVTILACFGRSHSEYPL